MRSTIVLLAVAVLHYPVSAGPHRPVACGATPETAPRSAPAFLECARAATEPYRERAAAIADGYRLIGRDFPAMGEHWIHIGRMFDGVFDPASPEALAYVDVRGTPQLVGVAYAMPLLPGEHAPDWPAGEGAWHDHTRTVDVETVMPEHHHGSTHAADRARLAMLHAWVWTENPAGVFAADNWAIPFVRLGRPTPQLASLDAAKALSLASGSAAYFVSSVDAAASLTSREHGAVNAAFTRAGAAVEDVVRGRASSALTAQDLDRLDRVWRELWTAIGQSVSPETRRLLAPLSVR